MLLMVVAAISILAFSYSLTLLATYLLHACCCVCKCLLALRNLTFDYTRATQVVVKI